MARSTGEDPVARLSRVNLDQLPSDGGERYNRLIFEKSPYLLQHAENPVDWHPWGEEALERARREDKPVFLSIGYSTCHWCHVMAHESFEAEEVAHLLNRHFVSVKVDREERPDVDGAYMNVCQMMTGSGGWPLTLVLTPDGKPFFAATYLPKTGRGKMAGLIPLLEKIAELWLTDRLRLLETGNQVAEALNRLHLSAAEPVALDKALLRRAYEQFLATFDRRHAGFGSAPKFPTPHNLSLLLRLWLRTGEEKARAMAVQTLQAMRLGGIYDQIGFGIHRYSVDAQWIVPHFEKMLYDQALFTWACLEAFQETGDTFFSQSAAEVIEYVTRDLADAGGGFYCGEDADSEGEEGTFYLWRPAQVKELLGEEMGTVFCTCFDITEEGNFEGKSIPRLAQDVGALAERIGVEAQELGSLLAEGRRRLFLARQGRVRPHRDDKILTGWNGLMIASLARAGVVLRDDALWEKARGAADFILSVLRTPEGRLLRRYRLGEAAVPGFLEDYAFFVWGLTEIAMTPDGSRYLAPALKLMDETERLFGDGKGGFFETGADAEIVLTRGKSLQDGAIPSGTSVAAWNLLRLARLTGDPAMEARGERALRSALGQAAHYPTAFSMLLICLDFALGPKTEIVLAPSDGRMPEDFLQVLASYFLPRTTVLHRCSDGELERIAPTAQGKDPVKGRSAAYLCREQSCREPVTEAGDLKRMLEERPEFLPTL